MIECFGKSYNHIIGQISSRNAPNTEVMAKSIHSLVQQDKFDKAKAKVGKVFQVLIKVIEILIDI